MVRVRFAPSPTGELHLGGARTALFNYLFARRNKGKFVLRIEDTDVKRFVPGSTERIIESLKFLGLEFDEGPYFQSKRLKFYQKYAEELIAKKAGYYCFCSEERLKRLREEQLAKGLPPMYDRKCYKLTPKEVLKNIQKGKKKVVRLYVPREGKTIVNDLIRGRVEFDHKTLDDQVLLKSDGYPTYHLANVVDDHLMKITHVIRAEEWLPSTPKHILLYRIFGWKVPEFAHIPLLLAYDRSKLSKRHGAVSVIEYQRMGYLPEALVNFLALLGWNPKTDQEFWTLAELEKKFELSGVQKAGAVFDIDKLNFLNGHYIRQMKPEELLEKVIKFLQPKKFQKNLWLKIITVIRERMVKFSDFDALSKMFFKLPKYDAKILIFKKSDRAKTKIGLEKALAGLEKLSEKQLENPEALKRVLEKTVAENNLANGDVFWPVRVALSGSEASPSPQEMLWALGKSESLKRINWAMGKL